MKKSAVFAPKQKDMPRWKRCCCYLPAPAVTAALLLVVYGIFRLYPFGRNMFAWGDMTQQSIPLLLDFKNILSGQFDLFLNTANAGGTSFWGIFLFFLSSPFSFLVALVDTKEIFLFANVLVLLKMAACAFTACLFFRKQFPRLDLTQQTALSVMYAFCGFALLYYQNMVWLDMMYLFPLLLWGLCRLLQKGKIGLYTAALSATVAVNYYLSYMVIMFLILAMALYVFWAAEKGTRKKTAALFCGASLIAALLTGVFWMPSFFQYTQSARTTDIFTSLSTSNFFTTVPTVFPVILSTAAVLAVIPLFFLTKRYRERKQTALFVLYVLLLIPVVIEPINKMWHTGSYQAFPVRYGYITVMIGLCLVASFLCQTNQAHRLSRPPVQTSRSIGVIAACHVLALAVVAALLLLFRLETVSFYVRKLWLSAESFLYFLLFAGLAVLVCFMVFVLYRNRLLSKKVFNIVLCCIVACESFFCSSAFLGAAARSIWSYSAALNLSSQLENTDDLFRAKLNKKYFDVNLVGGMGYNTLSHYTSLTDEDFLFTMKKLGYSAYWMESGSNGGTLLTDILLANRYVIFRNRDTDLSKKDKLYEGMLYCLVEQEDVRSFGTVFSSDDVAALQDLPEGSRLELQTYLADVFFGCGKAFHPYEPTSKKNLRSFALNGRQIFTRIDGTENGILRYTIPVKGEQTLYFDCFDNISTNLKESINGSFDVYVDGIRIEAGYPTQSDNGLLCLGTFEDEMVSVEVRVKKTVRAKSFGVFGTDNEAIRKASRQATVPKLTRQGSTIRGTATAAGDNDYLFLPMTWDSGFTATVNGKAAELLPVFDAFMAVPLEKGENTVTLSYMPRGFKTGLLLTAAGAVAFALALWALRKRWVRRLRWLYTPLYIAFGVLALAVFSVLYLMPLIINIFF